MGKGQALMSKRRSAIESDEPLSPTLSPHAGKGSQTCITSPSLRAGRDLGRGKFTIQRVSVVVQALRPHVHIEASGVESVALVQPQRLCIALLRIYAHASDSAVVEMLHQIGEQCPTDACPLHGWPGCPPRQVRAILG